MPLIYKTTIMKDTIQKSYSYVPKHVAQHKGKARQVKKVSWDDSGSEISQSSELIAWSTGGNRVPTWLQLEMALRTRQLQVHIQTDELLGSNKHDESLHYRHKKKPGRHRRPSDSGSDVSLPEVRQLAPVRLQLDPAVRSQRSFTGRSVPRLTKRHGNYDPLLNRNTDKSQFIVMDTSHGQYLICKDSPRARNPRLKKGIFTSSTYTTTRRSQLTSKSTVGFYQPPPSSLRAPGNRRYMTTLTANLTRENTDYEPLESIAQRNNLDILHQLTSSPVPLRPQASPMAPVATTSKESQRGGDISYLNVKIGRQISRLQLPKLQT